MMAQKHKNSRLVLEHLTRRWRPLGEAVGLAAIVCVISSISPVSEVTAAAALFFLGYYNRHHNTLLIIQDRYKGMLFP